MIVGLALMSLFAWFHIELTAKILGVALVGEVLALRRDGRRRSSPRRRRRRLQRRAAEPGRTSSTTRPRSRCSAAAPRASRCSARSGRGSASRWRPNYAEESRDPHKIAKTATYGSVIGLGVFYIFISYMFVTGWGLTGSAQAVEDQFAGKYRLGVLPADRPVRRLLADHADRDPDRHRARSPARWRSTTPAPATCSRSAARACCPARSAARTQAARARSSRRWSSPRSSALYCLAFAIYDPSTEGALLKLGTWSPLLGVLGILAVQALVSIAIIRYFLTAGARRLPLVHDAGRAGDRLPRDGGRLLLLVANRGDLSGAARRRLHQDPALGRARRLRRSGWRWPPYLRSSAPDRYARIGQFELSDSPDPHRTTDTTGAQA